MPNPVPQMNEVVQFLKAALAPIAALFACWVAFRQYQIKKLELRLARYDRRFKIYQALKDFIATVINDPKISADAVRQFDIATNEASFLFEEDVCEYLALIRRKSQSMADLSRRIEELLVDRQMNDERTVLVNEKLQLADWFFDQFHDSKNQFARYLSVRDENAKCRHEH
jgi:hypothetical protein